MGKILMILFAVICMASMRKPHRVSYTGTMVDTTIDGYNAVVYRPATYWTNGNSDSSIQCIVFSYGCGEIAASYATLRSIGGPIAYLEGGWDGKVTLVNGDHYPIIIGLRIPLCFPTAGQPLAKLDAIRAAFKIKKVNLHTSGFSSGGYAYKIVATEDAYDATAPYGPFTYADGMKSIVDLQGVTPDDNAQWYDKIKNFARNGNGGGHYLAFIGTEGFYYEMPRTVDSMNAAVPGSGVSVTLTGEGHTWQFVNRITGKPDGTAAESFSIGGVNQTVYQWMLRQGDTTLAGVTRYRIKKRVQ